MYEQLRAFAKKNRILHAVYRKLIKADVIEQKFMDLEEKVIYKHVYQLEQRVRELEQRLDINTNTPAIVFNEINESEPSLDNPVSQVATAAQMNSPIYQMWAERLNLPNYPHRKTWEFVYICQVLDKQGLVKPGNKGVGFGVGKDPIVAYLARNHVDILATDLNTEDAQASGWVDTNQHVSHIKMLNDRGIAAESDIKNHVRFEFVDMNHIPDDIEGYDFIWSACALEHLGSIEKGLEFVRNSLECLRPGGVAVHTTEFNMSSNKESVDNQQTVLFRRKDIENLAKEVIRDGHFVELNFNTGCSSLDRFYDVPPYSDYTHLRLLIGKYISTSIGLVIKKRMR